MSHSNNPVILFFSTGVSDPDIMSHFLSSSMCYINMEEQGEYVDFVFYTPPPSLFMSLIEIPASPHCLETLP